MGNVTTGRFTVTALIDGATVFAADIFPGLDAVRVGAGAPAGFNAFVIHSPDGLLTLVDTGCGALFGDQGGGLTAALADFGASPDDIRRIILTHMHTDHCGGMLTGDGAPVFPNAKVILQATEAAHWRDKDHLAAQVLVACAARLDLIDGAAVIAPGLVAWPLPGHTPGHMGLRIGDDLVLIGDIIHAQGLQLADPQIATLYDVDPVAATAARIAALDEIATRGLVFSGGHLCGPDPFGRLTPFGAGYDLLPV